MKKIITILFVVLLSGCGKNFNKDYENITIGDKVESYQLDLRINGKFNNESINKIIKIDNYKNKEFKITVNEDTYYIINSQTYKEVSENNETENNGILGNIGFENLQKGEVTYEKTDEKIFYDSDIILQGLKNITSKKEVENDITGLDLKLYSVKFKDNFIKELLTKLGYNDTFEKVEGKVYYKDDTIYKITYKIDDLTISGTIFRINSIKELNINLGE